MTMIDLTTFKMGWRPNQFFAAPAGFEARAKPMTTVPDFNVALGELDAAMRSIALAAPRVDIVEEDASRHRVDFVQRSALFKFPDTISVQCVDRGEGRSSLAIYSRSSVGIGDMGVNKKRVLAWLDALSKKIGSG